LGQGALTDYKKPASGQLLPFGGHGSTVIHQGNAIADLVFAVNGIKDKLTFAAAMAGALVAPMAAWLLGFGHSF
jgi:hypothetical protein